MILNLEKPAARQAVTNPDSSFWLRASSEIRDGEAPAADAGGGTATPFPAGQEESLTPPLGEVFPDSGTQL